MDFKDFKEAFISFWPPKPTYSKKEYPELNGKIFIVTGGTGGIGLEAAKLLLAKGAKVYITGRGEAKLNKAISSLKEATPGAQVDFLVFDYDDLATIRPGVKKFIDQEKQLNGVVHNAGVMDPAYGTYTKQDYEEQLGVNNVAPQLVQKYLDPLLRETAKNAPKDSVRVVWVSSSAHYGAPPNGGIKWDDINFRNKKAGFARYGQSKAINIYQATLWGNKYESDGILSLAVHPGYLRSGLQRHKASLVQRLSWYIIWDPIYGAYSELYCLLNPAITAENKANLYQPWGRPGKARNDVTKAIEGEGGQKLWNYLEDEIKPFYKPF